METAITGGFVFTGEDVVRADVGIKGESIATVGEVDDADRVIDATGDLVLPGLINAHTHSPMALLRGYGEDLSFKNWLTNRMNPIGYSFTRETIAAGARLAALEMIKTGTTCFVDMYGHMDVVANVVDDVGLRAVLGQGVLPTKSGDEQIQTAIDRVVSFAREYDGTAGGRIHTAIMPHAPHTCPEWALSKLADHAVASGVLLHTHLSESVNEVRSVKSSSGVRPAHYLNELGCWEPTAFAAHGVHLNETEQELLAEQNVGIAHCPSANLKLGTGIASVVDLLEAGVEVCIGTDSAASNNNLDMLSEVRLAALLAKGSTNNGSAVPINQAIRMATHTPAQMLGLPTGMIKEGYSADLIVLETETPQFTPQHNLLANAVYAASGRDVTTTIVNGQVLMADDHVETMDEQTVLADARSAATAVLERHGSETGILNRDGSTKDQ
jgi:5-methylthioadenosine/S-adenosylhomocysteine deaminase